jgi:excisionase family DNA binding protein
VGGLRNTGGRRTGEALLSVEEVAEYFGVTTTTVYRWCKEGRIPCLKIGKLWRVRREELVDILEEAEESRGA